MKPGRYDIELYEGNSYLGPTIVLPDLSPFEGPPNLAVPGIVVEAEIYGAYVPESVSFAVEVLDPLARTVRPRLTAAQVRSVPEKAWWELRVTRGGFAKTILDGSVAKRGRVDE